MVLMPRSTARTVATWSPTASMTYSSAVVTSAVRSAPAIGGLASTAACMAANPCSAASPEKIPARIAPRSRRCRVSARVSTPLIPTTPYRASSSSRERVERQLDARRAGSRTT